MFEARLTQGGLLKRLMDVVKDIVDNGNFDCSASGFGLQAMDLRTFDHYRCDRNISLGFNMKSLAKFLKCAGDSDVADDDPPGDTMTFAFDSGDGDGIKEFQVNLMDIDCEQLEIPDTEFTATVRMPSSKFQRIIRELATIGDIVCISVTKDEVRFSTAGDSGKGSIPVRQAAVPGKPEDSTVINMHEPVELKFSIKYLISFAKAMVLSPVVTLSMSNELPIVVEYRINDIGHIKFYLAPKVDDDDLDANT